MPIYPFFYSELKASNQISFFTFLIIFPLESAGKVENFNKQCKRTNKY